VEIKCSYTKLVDLIDLVPNPKNSNKHSDKQIEVLAKIIKSRGMRHPLIVSNRSGFIVAGHCRLESLKHLGVEKAPVDFQDFKNEADEIFFLESDNHIAEFAEHDKEQMLSNLTDLDIDLTDFDFEDVGLIDFEMPGFDDEESETKSEDELTDEQKLKISEAWRQLAREYAEQFEILYKNDHTFSGISVGYAKVKFLESKYLSKEYPRKCSLAFHKDQFKTSGNKYSMYEGLLRVYDKRIKSDRLSFLCSGEISNLMAVGLSMNGARIPLDFPATLASKTISKYASHGRVLDPCHGWGGRLVGFLLSDAKEYLGVDPSPLQNNGVEKIKSAFLPLIDDKKDVKTICLPFEDANINKDYYDLAFTSPPYFDVEKYEGGKQSRETYSNYESWKRGFYTTLFVKTYESLKVGGHFCVQVGSQKYPLKDDGIEIAKKIGYKLITVENTSMTNQKGEIKDSGEVLIVLKKQ